VLFDLEAMKAMSKALYSSRIAAEFGADGLHAMRALLEVVNEVHRHLAYELWTDGFTIFSALDPDALLVDPSGSVVLTPEDLVQRIDRGATIQVLPAGRLRVWFRVVDPLTIGNDAVVYYFRNADYLVLGGALEPVPNSSGFPSVFGLPTFVELQDALSCYGRRLARRSGCYVLQACWFDDQHHLLKNKPETTMRQSLAQHLRSSLRAHEIVEVREEQNVDETHPVDIKVTWSLTNRLALIEIKWLGDSVNAEGAAISTQYREARANEGSRQLADYLDRNKSRAPEHVTRGYLVVFDARRRGLTGVGSVISAEDALYYANQEIVFDVKRETERSDFHAPIRFYLEPAA
jgi:hypothetical protein